MSSEEGQLTPEQLQRMKDLFAAALQLDAGERMAFLADAYRRDQSLRAGVESIVTHGEGPAPAPAAVLVSLIGRRIGPYEIRKEIGKGGMGVVYLAGRADEEFKRQVAIKLLRAGPESHEILRRFRTERQILATLDHPNIVKMLDGGTTEEGLPYFVMDYVEGVAIDVYCDRHKLRTAERLALFRQICSAVEYAHQRLIVHRDLKPSNILVTAEGVPKLLDFGIAKLMKPGLMTEVLDLTGAGVKLMTPEYASPEQVMGEPITTATDVYALGVILYELLSGRRPYRLKDLVLHELMRAICEDEPEPPSTAVLRGAEEAAWGRTTPDTRDTQGVAADSLSRRLRGELDNIVLMALRKEPSRRYSSVEQFSSDIRRYLDGLPVMAQKDTVRYRTTKFVRRHSIGVGASLLLVLTLLAGIASTAWQARIAQRRFEEVRTLANKLLTEFQDSIANLPGATKPREVLVRRGLEYLDKLAREASGDQSLQRDLAEAYDQMGDVQGNPRSANLGDAAGALASYGKSLAIRERLYREAPTLALRRKLTMSYMMLGDMQYAIGKRRESLESYRRALALAEQSAAESPKSIPIRREVAMNQQNIGDLLVEAGDLAGAAGKFSQALDIAEELARENPRDWRHTRDLALAHNKMGDVLWYKGELRQALEHYQTALADREGLAAAHPADALLRREVLPSFHNVGDTLEKMGDVRGALAYYRKSLELSTSMVAADASNSQAQRDLCLSHARVGGSELKLGNHAAALESFRSELQIARAMAASDPTNVLPRRDLADALSNLGEAYRKLNDCGRARQYYTESLGLYTELGKQGVLGQPDAGLPRQVAAEIGKCENR